MPDIMIDLETLGTGHDCHILSIGACNIYYPQEQFYAVMKADGQNRKIDEGTVRWWMAQSKDAQAVFHVEQSQCVTLEIALASLSEWCQRQCKDATDVIRPWSHGATFDLMILHDAYNQYPDTNVPWLYWNMRDTRTLFDVANRLGVNSKPERLGTHHNALDDALFQAQWVRETIAALKHCN